LGWLILVEDCQMSRTRGVRLEAPHFDVFPEFVSASYLQRYDILCHKLVLENLYTHAALVTTERDSDPAGTHGSLNQSTSLLGFASAFAGHVAACATAQTRGAP